MKKHISSIRFLLAVSAVGIVSLSPLTQTTVQAQEKDITCSNVKNYSAKFSFADTPFLDVDIDKTVAKLSEENAEMVRKLVDDMESLFDKLEKADSLNEVDEEVLMVKIEALEEELEVILDDEGVEPVEINLLDQLSKKDRKKAIGTWCEIAKIMDDEEKKIENKFEKLDRILSRSEH